jgi:hypothetical protein
MHGCQQDHSAGQVGEDGQTAAGREWTPMGEWRDLVVKVTQSKNVDG